MSVRAIVLLCVGVLLVAGYFVVRPEDNEVEQAEKTATQAPSSQIHEKGEEPAQLATVTERDVPAEVEDFVRTYASAGPSAEQLAELEAVTTPALHASMATSDRELARGATTILEIDETHAAIGAEDTMIYTVHFAQLDTDHEQDGDEPARSVVVTAVDFADPPEGAFLPLGSDGTEQLREPVQEALTAVVAQPGGQSDRDREALLKEVFRDPQDALSMPRVAPAGSVVRIGNAHELVPADEDGQLVVHATVPYEAGGDESPTWVTVTVELTRDDAGGWAPQDARL